MKITAIRVHRLEARLRQRFAWSLHWTDKRVGTLVEVETDSGLTGWGDGAVPDAALAKMQGFIGRSPFEAEAIFDELRAPGLLQGRPGEPMFGSLDVALWDLQGKALGLPVCNLLGRVYRRQVRPYCTALYRVDCGDLPRALAEEAAGWKAQGYATMKMKIGYGPDLDIRCVEAVRNAIGGDTGLAVDSNCAYDAPTAIALGARLEAFNIRWWEEPLDALDLEGYRRLRQAVRIPLASGESLTADTLARDYIAPRLIDIVQPEVEWIGLTGARRITPLAWLQHIKVVPHNWSTAIRTATVLHWAATIPPPTIGLATNEVTFEFDQTEHPFRDAVVNESITPGSDGIMHVPDKPGLGVTVNRKALERFTTGRIDIS
jgi:D-galactarolactone cycloisomerase